ncbi:hypothetical protein L3X37_05085 [Sabulilitoribacter arenilitoris]|uniref:Uncharacterized protein n=1 Tax=Wocania arenilitoris TaxID=2044858 RepID=A0AAE3EPA2_9FLAO|nr:hypothetical protein [Wocania arenilitoris]MCF7567739.1 hypothetical protein [Wocania arenilitoris]
MFKQRKHRTFKYKPRFSEDEKGNPLKESENKPDFVFKWKDGISRKRKRGISMPVLIIILVLLLICMFWLESKIN